MTAVNPLKECLQLNCFNTVKFSTIHSIELVNPQCYYFHPLHINNKTISNTPTNTDKINNKKNKNDDNGSINNNNNSSDDDDTLVKVITIIPSKYHMIDEDDEEDEDVEMLHLFDKISNFDIDDDTDDFGKSNTSTTTETETEDEEKEKVKQPVYRKPLRIKKILFEKNETDENLQKMCMLGDTKPDFGDSTARLFNNTEIDDDDDDDDYIPSKSNTPLSSNRETDNSSSCDGSDDDSYLEELEFNENESMNIHFNNSKEEERETSKIIVESKEIVGKEEKKECKELEELEKQNKKKYKTDYNTDSDNDSLVTEHLLSDDDSKSKLSHSNISSSHSSPVYKVTSTSTNGSQPKSEPIPQTVKIGEDNDRMIEKNDEDSTDEEDVKDFVDYEKKKEKEKPEGDEGNASDNSDESLVKEENKPKYYRYLSSLKHHASSIESDAYESGSEAEMVCFEEEDSSIESDIDDINELKDNKIFRRSIVKSSINHNQFIKFGADDEDEEDGSEYDSEYDDDDDDEDDDNDDDDNEHSTDEDDYDEDDDDGCSSYYSTDSD